MRKCKFALMALMLSMVSWKAYALEQNVKMGKPTDEEMSMTSYEEDADAKAVVLYSETDVRYEYNVGLGEFRLVYYRKERVKVLTSEGVEAGNVIIEYVDPEENNSSRESVSGLKVSTYNLENGKVVRSKMGSDMQTIERVDKFNSRLKFAAPNVKAGSVIEYEYKLNSDFYFSPNTWYAQGEYPVFYTKYIISVPDWFGFRCYPSGICELKYTREEENYSIVVAGSEPIATLAYSHKYEGFKLPALDDSDHVFCLHDYCTRVEHELKHVQVPGSFYRQYNSSWTSLAYSLYKDDDFGARYKMKNPLAEQQAALNLPADMPAEEKAEKLRQLLLQNYKWDGSYSIWGISTRKIRNDKDRELNMGSFDFTLMSMLRDAGLNVSPVVMSRRSKGRLPYYPSSRYFNAMALRVETSDSTHFYLDPTADGYPVGVLPPELLVSHGIVISTESAKDVDLRYSSDGRTVTGVQASIDANGMLKGHADIQYLQQCAGSFRSSYRAAKDSTEFAQQRATDDNVLITSYSLQNAKDNSDAVKESIDFTQELQKAGDLIYVNPFLFVDFKAGFAAESRILPVEWPYALSERVSIMIDVPEGYEVEALPKSKTLQFGQDMSVRTRVNAANGKIIISYTYVRKNMIVDAEMYSDLRAYYGDIESTIQEMLILRKKS